MRIRNVQGWRISAGLIAIAAVLAVVTVITVTVANNNAPAASAIGPTPTKIANSGSLGGVVDILIHAGGTTGIFTCIGKVDHEAGSNLIKTALQCYSDQAGLESENAPPTWAEIVCVDDDPCPNPDLRNPSEPGPNGLAGPPPPPPYTAAAPSKAFGAFYPGGHADCVARIAFWGPTDPCIIQTACIEDLSIVIGPNVIIKAYTGDPEDAGGFAAPNDTGGDGQSHGAVDVYYNQANSSCKTGEPEGPPNLDALSITTWDVYDKAGTPNASSPWRIANPNGSVDPTHDYDGDGCWDADELDKSYVAAGSGVKCGDDPFNPTDSFDADTVDLTGIYTIVSRLARWDCSSAQNCVNTPVAGIYTTCLAELRHNTQSNVLVMRPYCYADETSVQINQEAYPGVTGDGIPGAPPPGPSSPTACGDTDGSLGGGVQPACNYAYGDVDSKHAELSGSFNPTTNQITVAGCFIDEDGLGGVGDVWFVIDVSAHQLPGTATINLFQNEDCAGSPTGGSIPSVVTFVKQTKGLARDDDQDGVPTSRELQDDIACGLRDPFNKNDYYDVSIPRDSKVDLFNDIVGVINNYEPVFYSDGATANVGVGTMENYDRPASMIGGAGHWNRGSPDGKIDLFNDIVGVINQYNPQGCPPLS